jgi:lipopolysaccharide biosynthesis regulator YciM
MPKNGDYGQIRRNLELTKYQFVITELDLAITFCEIALSSEQHDKFERNSGNAQKAYQAASKFMDQSQLTEEMRLEIADRISTLEQLLKEISNRTNGFKVQAG